MPREILPWSFTPLVAAYLLAAPWAHASPPDQDQAIAAQVLNEDAIAAMNRKDFKSACPKLEEAAALLPDGFGIALNLGDCYASSARLASAWKSYSRAEAIASGAGRTQRRIKARQKADALRHRLATLTLVVPEVVAAIPGLDVRRDGVPAGSAQWGTPIPVDKGAHGIVVEAPGRGRWEKTITIPDDDVHVDVTIEAQPPPAPPFAPRTPAATTLARLPRVRPSDAGLLRESPSAQRMIALVTGGAGLVALGVGSAYGLKALSKKNESYASLCSPSNLCDSTAERLWSEAHDAGAIATAFIIGGGAATAAGLILWMTVPAARYVGQASVAVGPRGVAVSGQW